MELQTNVSFSANGTFTNSTAPLSDRSMIVSGVRIFIAICSLFLNSAILVFHLFKPAYITDFTIYLLFLYFVNTVYLIGAQPLLFWSELTGLDVGYLGRPVCMLFNYVQRVVSILPVMCHTLIALNRFWAIQYPLSYRNRHTRKTAVFIGLAMVGYVHILTMPPFFVYMPLRYQPITETTGRCQDRIIPSYIPWSRTDSIMNRFMPLFVVIGVYAHLIIKRYLDRKKRAAVRMHISATGSESIRTGTGRPARPDATLHRSVVRPFVVLTLTTIGVVVCWLPLDIIFACQYMFSMGIPPALFGAFLMLYTLQILFDPLMWIFSLRFRRNKVK